MVVKGRDFGYLREQALVGLLKIRAGERTGLGDGDRWQANCGAGE
jgi:hypothetical protein